MFVNLLWLKDQESLIHYWILICHGSWFISLASIFGRKWRGGGGGARGSAGAKHPTGSMIRLRFTLVPLWLYLLCSRRCDEILEKLGFESQHWNLINPNLSFCLLRVWAATLLKCVFNNTSPAVRLYANQLGQRNSCVSTSKHYQL